MNREDEDGDIYSEVAAKVEVSSVVADGGVDEGAVLEVELWFESRFSQ